MNSIINRSVIYKIGITGTLIKSFFKHKLSEAGINITPEQYLLLRELKKREDSPTIQQLTHATLKDSASVSRTIEILVKKEWITRKIARHDKRVRYISLTQKGKDILEKSNPVVSEINNCIIKNLNNLELEQIAQKMDIIHKNIEIN